MIQPAMMNPSCLLTALCCAALAAAEGAPQPVSRTALDAETGIVAVTVHNPGAPLRLSLEAFTRPAATYTYHLTPLIDGKPGLATLTSAQGIRRPAAIAGQEPPAPPPAEIITLAGPVVAGYAFPIWETGLWSQFPRRFAEAPVWRVRAIVTLSRQDRLGMSDERITAEIGDGFLLDQAVWAALERVHGRRNTGE